MANDTAKSTQTRREARKARRAGNEVKAEVQDQALLNAATPEAKAEAAANAPAPKVAKPRKEQVAEQRAATAAEADAQALLSPDEPDVERLRHVGALRAGAKVPLHILNAMARQHNRKVKSEARETANVVGKAAFQHLSGKRAPAAVDKHARMRDALSAGQKVVDAVAAKAAEGDGK